ncbi:MAG: response regulator [Zetaproteobacteria bacterium CG06_land_8_20_14_3_00_59_53]|nr:MAG: hypothetical protein AUK36_11245 [Zetaproteobacteria bacterium CG2_30_59_37]PIO89681.1 MAG: response regulator [Zetaproteobacteria bacterium CG23_combo_of_CG06-09_8_20_14_all_59_86]PIQ65750.1 MAG: response regulator [Zetaproteobacteria bacterium CG11_big_fil_rev_8_21_14_0_20_59_439]PIU70091.1 MAG: response regulator [Zetaproteobacteria bacterium CG06_land_8_20_14_3_00_59_53]PIU96572.1 MAG: response regulator [Zetaproteobacteria bacterium CG03_land_8_20_14_0_80_59_51]PIY46098.1 MAG: res
MSRPALVFVHGWAQSAKTWHAQVAHFAPHFAVHTPNLPGHGGAPDMPLETWQDALLSALPDGPVMLIGWSLGGMLGLQLATHHPERLTGLVLLSSTPCFRQQADWQHGCEDAVFERFAEALATDAPRLLDRFFALMMQGDELSRRQYVDIARHAVDKRHPASPAGLQDGLRLLDELDLRASLAAVRVPTLIVHGEHDAVTPVGAARFMDGAIPDGDLKVLPSGHALHLCHAQALNELLEEWCLSNISTHDR